MRRLIVLLLSLLVVSPALAEPILIRPAQLFDGVDPTRTRAGRCWSGASGSRRSARTSRRRRAPVIDLPGTTLMPGMIEGHSHLFLHPYNETSWDDQVLREPLALRTARAVAAARSTLMAGFTTDARPRHRGRRLCRRRAQRRDRAGHRAGPAHAGRDPRDRRHRRLRARSSPIPTFAAWARRKRTAPALRVAARRPDRRRRRHREALRRLSLAARASRADATFTIEEMRGAVEVAHGAGRIAAAHASTAEGMRRAILAGVDTIEHGNEGTPEVFRLMREHGVGYCPTLAASDAIARYSGWNGAAPEPEIDPDEARQLRRRAGRRRRRCAWAATSASSRTARMPARWS